MEVRRVCSRKIHCAESALKSYDKTLVTIKRLLTDTDFIFFFFDPVKIFGIMYFEQHTLTLKITKNSTRVSRVVEVKLHIYELMLRASDLLLDLCFRHEKTKPIVKASLYSNSGSLESLKWTALLFFFLCARTENVKPKSYSF